MCVRGSRLAGWIVAVTRSPFFQMTGSRNMEKWNSSSPTVLRRYKVREGHISVMISEMDAVKAFVSAGCCSSSHTTHPGHRTGSTQIVGGVMAGVPYQ